MEYFPVPPQELQAKNKKLKIPPAFEIETSPLNL